MMPSEIPSKQNTDTRDKTIVIAILKITIIVFLPKYASIIQPNIAPRSEQTPINADIEVFDRLSPLKSIFEYS